MSRNLSDVSVPVVIVGDSAFKLSQNLMKPYPFSTDQSDCEKIFNYTLSKCGRVVENCFGHLKARFRRLGKGLDNNIDHANLIIKACCVIHNFLNGKNDTLNRTWLLELEATEKSRQDPISDNYLADVNANAQQIKNAIASFLADGADETHEESNSDDVLESEFGDGVGSGTTTGSITHENKFKQKNCDPNQISCNKQKSW